MFAFSIFSLFTQEINRPDEKVMFTEATRFLWMRSTCINIMTHCDEPFSEQVLGSVQVEKKRPRLRGQKQGCSLPWGDKCRLDNAQTWKCDICCFWAIRHNGVCFTYRFTGSSKSLEIIEKGKMWGAMNCWKWEGIWSRWVFRNCSRGNNSVGFFTSTPKSYAPCVLQIGIG